jgi:hypothetical protein
MHIASSATPIPNASVSDTDALRAYGMKKVAEVRIADGSRFAISITDTVLASLETCIYAFLVGGKIMRIGSSKAPLWKRLRSWERLVTARWQNPDGPSDTPQWEADGWRKCLEDYGCGEIHARQGTEVTTPVGVFCAYLSEESVLIGRHRPSLNRSMHR